ncbi:MAG TPA: hypothetical protein VF353_05845, partial [Candidatus Binatia bacterium]
KEAVPAKDHTSTATPLVTLISSLAQRKDTRQIFIQRKDFSLRLEQRSDKASMAAHPGSLNRDGRLSTDQG